MRDKEYCCHVCSRSLGPHDFLSHILGRKHRAAVQAQLGEVGAEERISHYVLRCTAPSSPIAPGLDFWVVYLEQVLHQGRDSLHCQF